MKHKMIQIMSIIALSVAITPAHAKEAKCTITGADHAGRPSNLFDGQCDFEAGRNGSFTLKSLESKWEPLWDTTLHVYVDIVKKGVAEVTVFDIETEASRSWGTAKRSKKDSACWIGNGFEICAR